MIIYNFDLENVGNFHGVQLLQCCHSMAKKSISIKVICYIYMLARTISEILTIEIFDLEKVGHGHGILLLQFEIFEFENVGQGYFILLL